MRQAQHGKKPRGRGRKPHNPLSRVYDSNGPDVKVRGTASHIADKYLNLARDAHSSGDRIAAESYLQYAEHYQRIIAAAQAQMGATIGQSSEAMAGDDGGDQPDGDDYGGDFIDRAGSERFNGDRQGGERYAGERQGGERQGGERQGGERYAGERQGGERQGGERQGGERQGGERQGGERQGGERQGGERADRGSDPQPYVEGRSRRGRRRNGARGGEQNDGGPSEMNGDRQQHGGWNAPRESSQVAQEGNGGPAHAPESGADAQHSEPEPTNGSDDQDNFTA